MKAFACALLLTVSGLLPGQEKDVKWQRVYTVPYKSRLETIEYVCEPSQNVLFSENVLPAPSFARQYRVYETTLLDAKGTVIEHISSDPSAEWKEVRFGSMMEKLSIPACKLIYEKRRNP